MNTSAGLPDSITTWLRSRRQAVLVTTRTDGTAQTSNIVFAFDGTVARVSVTADRAKTRNLQRDPRGVLHVLGDSFWQYASVRVHAQPGPVSVTPGDAPGQELLELYRTVTGSDHPDPQEFYAAMVAEQRLVLRLVPEAAVGAGLPD